ncbi:MAG TPA: hypothetical protein VK815_05405 [Candidatus Acidoferrales bacterium]|nr:hypothetical protein [Candidatus Acidoferrales bacterium]
MKFKRILKWLLGLFLLGVVALVILFLSRDIIFRAMVVRSIRDQTHMKAEIGKFHLGLREPVIYIRDLKLYNPTNYGGTPLLVIPEIYVEYDRDALKTKSELHITLLRFNLGEVDIVKNTAGQTNLMELGLTLPSKDDLAKSKDTDMIKKRTGLEFKGIDMLTVSVGKAKYIDLGDPKNNREQDIDLQNVPIANVKSGADLTGLLLLVTLRSDNFFTTLAPPDLK